MLNFYQNSIPAYLGSIPPVISDKRIEMLKTKRQQTQIYDNVFSVRALVQMS
jgi:hypothetical protein